ncbi:RGG repeats nuclear RNA binding protein A-like [Papaver somniferum]|uniref:RGG repeats nuclear RNA binding protein A-like n=1 Tax=Papaver somniferum TaxID=3469 RepID=UPI000E704683|nr:RGG repeats nuclear RNA binding protein A-like [Papaver somniferum]
MADGLYNEPCSRWRMVAVVMLVVDGSKQLLALVVETSGAEMGFYQQMGNCRRCRDREARQGTGGVGVYRSLNNFSAPKISHPSLVKEKTKNAAPAAQLPSKPLSPAEYVRTEGRGTGRGTGGRGTGRGTGGRGTGRGGHGDNYQTDSTTNGGNADWKVVRYGHGDGKGKGASVSNGGNADWKNKDGRGGGRGNGNRGYSKNENIKTSDVPTEEEEEDKEMSLAEFEKVRLEKKKALNAVKSEERKVVALENEFKDMKILGKKKEEELSSIKLQKSGKGKLKKKESLAEEKARKSMLLQEFLKPVEQEKSDNSGKGSDNGAQGHRTGLSREGSSEQPKKEIKRATQFR